MKLKNNFLLFIATFFISCFFSCKKQDGFLDAKPDASLSVISSITDINNLLSNEQIFNRNIDPALGELSTDDYYITSATWLSKIPSADQNTYIFAKDIFSTTDLVNDWSKPYSAIYYANTVLEALPKILASKNDINTAKGSALFYRAYSLYNLLQCFALPYDSKTAGSDLGVPIKLTSNPNSKSTRATIQQCYDQIFSDINSAIPILPKKSSYTTQPNLAAAYALLARINLVLFRYQVASNYADSALTLNNRLTDYNTLVSGSSTFIVANATSYPLIEDIYHSTLLNPVALGSNNQIVDSILYSSYAVNDLRKTLFFRFSSGAFRFKGSYEFKTGGVYFSGLATDELYLIRAECQSRLGNPSKALDDLNTLLANRYKTNTYVPYTIVSTPDPLPLILQERRKELLFRGLRWTDLRRLNKDPKFAITIIHVINGTSYTLPPNDPRYAMQIPLTETSISGIQQNQR